jgi:hypothetical protein
MVDTPPPPIFYTYNDGWILGIFFFTSEKCSVHHVIIHSSDSVKPDGIHSIEQYSNIRFCWNITPRSLTLLTTLNLLPRMK